MALHNDIFKQQIWEFFCGDLDSCLLVSKLKQSGNNDFKGGLNFTACLTIFSVIELCSSYLKGKDSDTNTVTDLLAKYFSKYFDKFNDREFSRHFYYVFRHGLSHQWSPKASAIDMNFRDDYFIRKIKPGSVEILCLNIPVFYEYTKKALKDFEADLGNDENLRTIFGDRYSQIVNLDYKQMEILKNYV